MLLVDKEVAQAEMLKSQKRIREAHCNRVVFRTLLTVGCRIGELLLRVGDIELMPHEARHHLQAKGTEDHAPIVPGKTAEEILAFATLYEGQGKEGVFTAFLSKESAEKRIARELARISEMCGVEKRIPPLVLRASVATALHAQGVPLVFIQRLLNHRDIGTTTLYIRKANEREEAAALRLPWV